MLCFSTKIWPVLACSLRLGDCPHIPLDPTLIIDLTQYLERRRRTAEARVIQLASVSRHGRRVARRGTVETLQSRLGSVGAAVRWSSFLPRLPALELAGLYAEASLV